MVDYVDGLVRNPGFLGGRSVTERTEARKDMINTRGKSQSSKLIRGTFAGLQPVPADRKLGCDPAHALKRMIDIAPQCTLLSSV